MERSSIDPKTSILVKVYHDFGPNHPKEGIYKDDDNGRLSSFELFDDLEVWKLSDVVFLDNSPSVLGRVVTVDDQQVIVDVTYPQDHHHHHHHHDDGDSGGFQGDTTTTMTTSSPKSSLKVFKLSELETCPEGLDTISKMMSSSNTTMTAATGTSTQSGTATCTSAAAATNFDFSHCSSSTSYHHAGTVQHCPVCFLDPSPAKPAPIKNSSEHHHHHHHQQQQQPSSSFAATTSSSLSDGAAQQVSARLYGFRPLAIQATTFGPNLLLERVLDGRAFLVCSAHLNASSLYATSFVALGHRGTKTSRCTIKEESVFATESGLLSSSSLKHVVIDWSSNTRKCGPSTSPKKDGGAKQKLSSRKQKFAVRDASDDDDVVVRVKPGSLSLRSGFHSEKTGLGSQLLASPGLQSGSPPSAKFVVLDASQPDLFCIQDINGCIWPLLDGLNLRSSVYADNEENRQGLPLLSYRCIHSRQYTTENNENLAVFTLGRYMHTYTYVRIYMYIHVRTYVYVHVCIMYVRMSVHNHV